MLIAQAQFPYFVDTTLYVHHLYGYIHNADIGPSQYLGINKESYLLKYEPPFYRIAGGTKLQLSPYVGECTDCFCLSGIYHPGSGYVVAGDMVCYPFHRGYPSVSGDTSSPANNPRADEFYRYAPLYGAFNLSTGWHTGQTFGTLNRQISHHYATGYLYNTIRSFACRSDGSLCAWIQWLDTCLELSNGKRIPLSITGRKRCSAQPALSQSQRQTITLLYTTLLALQYSDCGLQIQYVTCSGKLKSVGIHSTAMYAMQYSNSIT